MKRFTVIVEKGLDGYLISNVVELPGCHTQAKDHSSLMERTKEAIELYLEVNPEYDESKFVGLSQIEV